MSTEATKHDLVVTRMFDAPVAQLWKAWTDSDTLKQWWGPQGFTCPVAEMDLRVGSTSLVAMSSPDFGTHYSLWDYQVIEPLSRIDYIHNLADENGNKIDPQSVGMPPDFPTDQRHMLEFKSVGDGKTEFTVTEYGWTVGQMMEMSKMGMNQSLDKLETVLKSGI